MSPNTAADAPTSQVRMWWSQSRPVDGRVGCVNTAILTDSLGQPDSTNKNHKEFRFIDSIWANDFMRPGGQLSLTRADANLNMPTCTLASCTTYELYR